MPFLGYSPVFLFLSPFKALFLLHSFLIFKFITLALFFLLFHQRSVFSGSTRFFSFLFFFSFCGGIEGQNAFLFSLGERHPKICRKWLIFGMFFFRLDGWGSKWWVGVQNVRMGRGMSHHSPLFWCHHWVFLYLPAFG